MRNLRFKQLLILSNTQKSANQFKFKKGYNLITANDNSVGKSTLVKLLLWALGCEPSLSATWKSFDSKVLVKISINDEDYTIMRYGNVMYLEDSKGNLKKYPKITGDYAEKFASLVNFKVLLPKKGSDAELVTPPPAYYFLPFYIDQLKSWAIPWNNFDNLQQFSNWKPLVIKYHVGYIQPKYFELEKEYFEEKIKLDKYSKEVQKIDYALEVVSEQVLDKEMTLDKQAFDEMTEEIKIELSELSKNQEELLDKLSNLISDNVYLKHQKSIAEHLMKELDDDYIFSVENLKDSNIECPLCGTEHENSIVNRASILADKQQAANQLNSIDRHLEKTRKNIEKNKTLSSKIKIKIDEINSKYTITDNTKNIPLNKIIESFAYKAIDRDIKKSKKDKLLDIYDCKENQKSIKKEQDTLTTKERKEEIDSSFMELLNAYNKVLNVEEMNLVDITKPLDYNKIIKEGGAAEGTRSMFAYYLAIFSLLDIYTDEVKSPLIIDTPNQQEQAEKNYERIIKLITTKISKDEQIILCAMNNKKLKDFKKEAHVIHLDEKKLLDKSKYKDLKIIFDKIEMQEGL